MKQTLQSALQARGYSALTPVQEAVTRPELDGADLLVSAQTGSGKTVGFGLAIAPAILGDEERFGRAGAPLALVIAPTRELALQVRRELDWLYAEAGAVLASCVGGMDVRNERRALDRGAHILVATPGRLCDHLRRGAVDLSSVRAVVLDEADEMLDMGFREDLETILAAAPADRRTLMFSATVPAEIAALAKDFQRDAQRISVLGGGRQHSDIDYRAVLVAEHDEENAITNLLRFHEAPNAIVFGNTRATVARLVSRLSNRGFAVVALSGELSQAERSHALQAMRDGRARICVATDVAARGIDLPNLDLVIHAELPLSEETLLHRSGRTGRAGRKGVSALIVPPRARKRVERMLKAVKVEAVWEPAPSAEAVLERDEARLLADPVWSEPVQESETATLAQVLAARSPEDVALAMIRLWRGQRSAPEELSPVAPRVAPGTGFGASRWFSVPIGRDRKASPKWLMPKVCEAGGITREEIGAIRIGPEESFVEISEGAVPMVLEALGPLLEIAPGLSMTLLDEAPAEATRPGARSAPTGRFPRKPGKPWARREDEAPRPRSTDAGPEMAPRPVKQGKPWVRRDDDTARTKAPEAGSEAPRAFKSGAKPGAPRGKGKYASGGPGGWASKGPAKGPKTGGPKRGKGRP